MKNITLKDKINFIKKALKMSYYFFYLTKDNMILIIFENQKVKREILRGYNMFEAVIEGENYVLNEIEAGSIKNPENKIKETNDNILEDTTSEEIINQDNLK